VVLTDWMSSDGLAFTFQGEPMLVDIAAWDCTVILLVGFKLGVAKQRRSDKAITIA